MRALLALLVLLVAGPSFAADMAPFFRMGDPHILTATTTAQQVQIAQPPGATSYRFVNPCKVDVRIRTVTGMADQVTATTGTRFLARAVEVLASSPPMTNPRTVSIMALSDPGADGCKVELQYGSGQ